jgi:hypothetical protein
MELKNDRLATEWVDYLLKYIQGFRLYTDDESWIVADKPTEVEKMPEGVRAIFGMYNWAEYGLSPDYKKRLGRIAIRGSSACWNISHSLYDGVSLSTLATWFERGQSPPPQVFPDASDYALRDQLVGVSDADVHRHIAERETMTRIPWCHPPIPFTTDMRNESFEAALEYHTMPCYNPKTDKFVGLTDVMWRATLLLAHACNPGQTNSKISTWVNMRPYMSPTTVGNQITPIVIGAQGLQENWTLAQVEAAIRRSFTEQIKGKAYLKSLRAFDAKFPFPPPSSAYFDVSNSGYYPTGGKIVDMFLVQSFPAAYSIGALELGAATSYGGTRNRQFFRLPYSHAVFTRSEARKMWTALIHAFQNHTPNLTVKEAIADMRDVMEKTA